MVPLPFSFPEWLTTQRDAAEPSPDARSRLAENQNISCSHGLVKIQKNF